MACFGVIDSQNLSHIHLWPTLSPAAAFDQLASQHFAVMCASNSVVKVC